MKEKKKEKNKTKRKGVYFKRAFPHKIDFLT
jgi:hypothetical protein